ncbi:MGMT family protein [Arthrobacter castelli]|uniref:MGMT family protein n=1 Tax=Arthrobacter castelli TaxID=271431 RepID=UPI00040778D8|nr:MGMT family protein [Arthrobacter castelli]
MRDEYVDAVLAAVNLIPPGRVLAYGDIAELLDSAGPRQVGAVMSHYGGSAPWWRVLRANGEPPKCHDARALGHYENEGTPLKLTGSGVYRVDMRVARWQPSDTEIKAIEDLVAKMSHPCGEVVP